MIRQTINTLKGVIKNDPVVQCELYKDKGCSHVDGMLCDFPVCNMNLGHIKDKKKDLDGTK
jgi:hypothetical protein